jgi:hypothetical protein
LEDILKEIKEGNWYGRYFCFNIQMLHG